MLLFEKFCTTLVVNKYRGDLLMKVKFLNKFRENQQQRKLEKQRQQELTQQCNSELADVVSKVENPNVSREEAHAAFNNWLDKWFDD